MGSLVSGDMASLQFWKLLRLVYLTYKKIWIGYCQDEYQDQDIIIF